MGVRVQYGANYVTIDAVKSQQLMLRSLSMYTRTHAHTHTRLCVYMCVCVYIYIYAPHNDVSVNDGPHIGRRSHKIMI